MIIFAAKIRMVGGCLLTGMQNTYLREQGAALFAGV
jgi:hypothetical protein